ncbi:MAG: signal recognition particle-docking protein FtsY, partial [Bacillota bacterium]|nr:signal recognition particle-docking protein FtsY [Bacillota bacterium]
FLDKLKSSLIKTKQSFSNMLDGLFDIHAEIDDELYDELEFSLVTADVSVKSASDLIKRLREEIERRGVTDVRKVRAVLSDCIAEKLDSPKSVKKPGLNIVVIIGVNGVGKTTTIGKLAHLYKRQGNKVLVAAGDTFRAAAIDQLGVWAERADVQMIRQKEGGDPAAVIFDAIQAAKARGTDYLLCDTAGRLHNKVNLMNELEKIFRIIHREAPDANLEVFLVLDATTGQNAINQAKVFGEKQGITGIVLTKLDGTAKGGVVISIEDELGVPVKYIGLGEKIEDLDEFDAKAFAKALISE